MRNAAHVKRFDGDTTTVCLAMVIYLLTLIVLLLIRSPMTIPLQTQSALHRIQTWTLQPNLTQFDKRQYDR